MKSPKDPQPVFVKSTQGNKTPHRVHELQHFYPSGAARARCGLIASPEVTEGPATCVSCRRAAMKFD